MIGTTLGCYHIIERLGAGGMGVVYKAEDTQLGRFAALKVLPPEVSQDPQALERFLREARAVASLNHPNICSIYQIGDENGVRYIAMELLEGKNLRDHIVEGPVRLDHLLDWGMQFASGLDAAHSKCILHRDIKPANLFVTNQNVSKILDFGLAKTVLKRQPAGMGAGLTTTALTTDAHLTSQGTTVGTVAYMSPEQAAGEQLDARSDLFSFGVVLYEMSTKEVPFKGNTAAAIYGAILHVPSTPPSEINTDVSPELERIILKSLEKDRDLRYQSAAELRADLKRLKRDTGSGPTQAAVQAATPSGVAAARRSSSHRHSGATEQDVAEPKKSVAKWIAFVVVLAALAAVGGYFGTRSRNVATTDDVSLAFQNRRIMRLTSSGTASAGAISPDGRYLVHVSEESGLQSLWVRQIATNSNVEIVPKAEIRFTGITVSPDENFVYYTAGAVHSPVKDLYQVPILGGAPKKLLSDIESRVTFSPDGKQFAFIREDQEASYIVLANADGSNPHVLMQTKLPEELAAVSWSPDGTGVAFGKYLLDGGYHSEIWLYPFSGNPRQLSPHHWFNVNDIAYLQDGSGMVVNGTDPDSLFASQLWLLNTKIGVLRRITNDLNSYRGVTVSRDDNQLCTVLHETSSTIWTTGSKVQQFATPTSKLDAVLGLSWTPDGRIVYTSAPSGAPELWIADANGAHAKQLVAGTFFSSSPVVSADNKVFFTSSRAGNPDVWRVDIDGSNAKQITFGGLDLADAVTPDGKWLIFRSAANGLFGVFKVSADGGTPVKLAEVAGTPAAVSPDGKQIAFSYVDEAAGEWRVGVVSLDQGASVKTAA